MNLLEEIKNIILTNIHNANYTNIVATLAFLELLEKQEPDYKYTKNIVNNISLYTSEKKKIINSYFNFIFEKEDIQKIKLIIINKLKQCFYLTDSNIFINNNTKQIDKFLKKYATDFFVNLSSNNITIWSACDVFKLLIIHEEYNMVSDYDLPYVCMNILLLNNCQITIENYLQYLI